MKVITFYKYASLEDPEFFSKEHLSFCKSVGIKGKILVSKEGLNGGITGRDEDIEEYKRKLTSYEIFKDIKFKETFVEEEAYRKMFVRVRKEIVTFDDNVDYSKAARKIKPEQLKEMLDKNEGVVLLDVRNAYEIKIGKFKQAVHLDINKFTEFKSKINSLNSLKDKMIVTYCTGGVRCEKASAFLIENGFGNVLQLDGGILNYAEKCSDFHWEGKCFVFDRRMAISLNDSKEVHPISRCEVCDNFSDLYINCKNGNCDKLFICCKNCQRKFNGYCSEEFHS